jgi:hypothetical protein
MSMTSSDDQRKNAAQDIKATVNAADDVKAAVNRAISECELFLCSNIGSELARLSGQFTPDRDQYFRIMGELAAWCNNGNFTADEMLVLYGEPLRLESIRDIDQEVDTPIYAVMLTPAACKRYLARSTSENAPRLLRVWFPISETDHPQVATPPTTSPNDDASGDQPAAGPKPTKKRLHYRGRLATYMKQLWTKGSLPDDDGDVERNFRKWYEAESKAKRLGPLPQQRRYVICQIAAIRSSVPAPTPSNAPVKQPTTTHKNQ